MDADKWTDAELKRLEARIAKEYKQASEELQEKAIRYFNGYDEDVNGKTIHHKGYYERKAEEYKAMQKGVYSQDDYNAWMYAQLGRGEHWEKLRDQMSDRLNDANKIAQDYANGILPKVYTTNYNYVAKIAQDSAMEQGIMGIKFDLVDEYTVKRLMEQSSEVRPYKPIEISLDKNTQYNKTKLQNALLQGILQGESVQKIATRFAKATNMQRACAIRNARTAVTGARNAGKQDRYADLASKGCQTFKKWKATADERTRTEHMQAWSDYGTDDKAIPYDEPFDVGGEELMYPADRAGSPWNIYNCRCTMASVFKFKSIRSEYSQKVDSIKLVGENTGKAKIKKTSKLTDAKLSGITGAKVDFSGMDERVAQEYREGIQEFYKQYPALNGYLNDIGTSISSIMESGETNVEWSYNGIIADVKASINLRGYKDYDAYIRDTEHNIKSGFKFAGDDGKATAMHECSHALQQLIVYTEKGLYKDGAFAEQNIMANLNKLYGDSVQNDANKIVRSALKKVNGANYNDKVGYLGEYAKQNNLETIAQAMAYEMSGNTNPFSREIKRQMDERYKKLFGA